MAGKTELYAPVPKNKPPKAKTKLEGEAGQGAEQGQSSATTVSEFDAKPSDSAAVAQWRSGAHA